MANETTAQHENPILESLPGESCATAGESPKGNAASAPAPAARNLADEQLVVLHQVAKSLAEQKNVNATLRLIAEKARFLTRCASTAVTLLDQDRQMLDFVAVAGDGAPEMIGQKVRVADALPGHTALTGEPLLAYNPSSAAHEVSAPGDGKSAVTATILPSEFRASESVRREPDLLTHGAVRSAAVVPIFVDGQSVGSLAAINKSESESFGGSDLLMLHILASSAAVAVQKQRLLWQGAQQERERDLLYEAAQATSSTLNVQEILDGVLATLGRSISSYAAIVFLLNDDRTHLFIGAERGLTGEDRDVQLLAECKLASAAFAGPSGTAYLISDTENDPRYEAIWAEDHVRPLSLLVAPLVSRESQMGLIVVASHQRDAYTKDDSRLLCAVAAQAAVALENAWLYEDATRRAEEATAIYELSQAVNTNLNLQRVLNFVADSVLALLHIDKFALFLHNPRTCTLDIMVARNIRREVVQSMHPTRQAGGIAWWVYEFETPTAVQNVAADHRNRSCPVDQEGVASLVSVPLQAGDEVIGVMHAMTSRRRLFTVAEMELLYTIANQVGVAISNIQMLEEARRRSAELRRSFRRVARALGTSLDTAQSADTIVDLAAEMMDADRTLLYSVEPGGPELILRAATGLRLPPEADPAEGGLVADSATSAAWIARRGRSLVVEDPLHDTRFAPPAALSHALMRSGSYLGVPLKIGSEIVGVLEIYTREPRSYPTEQIRQFWAFATQSAVALRNALLVEQAGRRRADLDMLCRLSVELVRLSGRELLQAAIRLLIGATQAECGKVILADGTAIREGICEAEMRLARERPETADTDREVAFEIAVPIGDAATIVLMRRYPPFDGNDAELLQTVANLLAAKGSIGV